MPYIPNPLNQVDQEFKYAVKAVLEFYASEVLGQGVFSTPINGTLAYNKRQALATKMLHNSEQYVAQASTLISAIDYNMLNTGIQSGNGFFRYLIDGNPTGRCLLDNVAGLGSLANYSFVGDNTGLSIFDKLAGITQGDMQ